MPNANPYPGFDLTQIKTLAHLLETAGGGAPEDHEHDTLSASQMTQIVNELLVPLLGGYEAILYGQLPAYVAALGAKLNADAGVADTDYPLEMPPAP